MSLSGDPQSAESPSCPVPHWPGLKTQAGLSQQQIGPRYANIHDCSEATLGVTSLCQTCQALVSCLPQPHSAVPGHQKHLNHPPRDPLIQHLPHSGRHGAQTLSLNQFALQLIKMVQCCMLYTGSSYYVQAECHCCTPASPVTLIPCAVQAASRSTSHMQ